MAIYENYGMEVAPPSDYTRHGEGDFLVQFWGKAFSFSKNGRTWYTKYSRQKEMSYGQDFYVNDATANENSKIFNSAYSPIKINYLSIYYSCTATSGTRNVALQSTSSDGTESDNVIIHQLAANETKTFILGTGGDLTALGSSDDLFIPIGIPLGTIINQKLKIYDMSDVDDNDDMGLWVRGWSMTHKNLDEVVLRNCSDLSIEYQADAPFLLTTGYGWFMNVIPLP